MSTFSNPLTEYSPQLEFEHAGPKPAERQSEHGIFDEHQEMEEAIALLEVANEQQLDRFLGTLIQETLCARRPVGPSSMCSRGSRATCSPLQEGRWISG